MNQQGSTNLQRQNVGSIGILCYKPQIYQHDICKICNVYFGMTNRRIAIMVKQVQFSAIHNKIAPFFKNLISFVF